MKRIAAVAMAVVAVLIAASSCSEAPAAPGPFTVTDMTSTSGQPEILLRPKGPVTGLVLYEHGYGQTQLAMLRVSALFPLRNALAQGGFAIAASDSGGNNFGNPASVRDQVDLLHDAESRLPRLANLDVVGFSMGGLDALLVASTHSLPGLHSLLLLSPACNQVPFLKTEFGPDIETAFGGLSGPALQAAITPSNPEFRAGSSYAGYRYWFWESPDDKTVEPLQPASMMAYLKRAGVGYSFSALNGDHGDLDLLRPADVVAFFEGRPAT